MNTRIVVINPNSSREVTAAMSEALEGLRFSDGPVIDCITLDDGPPGVETDRHVAEVAGLVVSAVEREYASAFVIACFSDPGLHAAKEASAVPVFGIGQAAYAAALATGERFGVISILSGALARHRRHVASLGLNERFAGDIAIDLGVTELSKEDLVLDRMTGAGTALKRDHGVDVVIMGCAGMARYHGALEDRLGIPVIEPTRAATALALNEVQGKRRMTVPVSPGC